ncbi:MAG TPA: carboxypeptidase regulatory-like domain-containing protein [Vicinamibacterales bacterium]|nr:carboxypeptidase regulatory-like domain-containing protein [Vicinamibacterales bacterium]
MQTCAHAVPGTVRPPWRSRLAISTLACTALLVPALHSEPAPSGSIAGLVRLTSRMRGTPISTNAYAPRAVSTQLPAGTPEMRSVVVYLKDVRYTGPLPAARAQIRQEHESFSPRVVAVTRGSTIDFPNFDPYFHNVFSLSGAATFDLGRYPEGQLRSRQFTKAGVIKVYCHIHSQMSATIVVLDHPYFATPDADGRFTIPDVPAGEYTLVGWHERVGEHASRITVPAGGTTQADVSLPVNEAR